MTPGLIEATKKATTFFAPQVLKQNVSPLNIEFLGDFYIYRQFRKNDNSHLQLGPKLEEFTGGKKDRGESLDHESCELEVVLQHQQLGDAAVDVLAGQQDAQLADDEGALGLQQAAVGAEELEQAEHELLEVRRGRSIRGGHVRGAHGRGGHGHVVGTLDWSAGLGRRDLC